MNLLFRLLQVLLRFVRNPARLKPLDVSTLNFRVWPNDLDTNLHMNNGRYLTLMDLGRFDLLLRVGIFRVGWKKKWIPVLGATTVRFRRSLKLFQKFDLKTRIIAWDATWVYIEQSIESEGQLYCLAYLRGLFTGPNGKVAMKELLDVIGADFNSSPILPEAISQWLKAEDSLYQDFQKR